MGYHFIHHFTYVISIPSSLYMKENIGLLYGASLLHMLLIVKELGF